MLTTASDFVAFAGKRNVYFQGLNQTSNQNQSEVSTLSFNEDWKDKNCSVECITASSDGHLIAVADSLHGLHVFIRKDKGDGGADDKETINWQLVHSAKSSKRVIKLEFTSDRKYLTFSDKQGDIFAMRITEGENGLQVSNIKKIMGHTSFISDYITRVETQQIFSCDRDEKIRISNFPDAFTIQGFKLGHTESIISMSLFPKAEYLLSCSVAGVIILWNLQEPIHGTSTNFQKKWDLKEVFPEAVEQEVTSMKAILNVNEIYLSVAFVGSTRVTVFRINIQSMELTTQHTLEVDSEVILMDWTENSKINPMCLAVFTPLIGSVRLWNCSSDTISPCKSIQNFGTIMLDDMKELGESLKPAQVRMKKRQTTFEDKTNQQQPNKKPKA